MFGRLVQIDFFCLVEKNVAPHDKNRLHLGETTSPELVHIMLLV